MLKPITPRIQTRVLRDLMKLSKEEERQQIVESLMEVSGRSEEVVLASIRKNRYPWLVRGFFYLLKRRYIEYSVLALCWVAFTQPKGILVVGLIIFTVSRIVAFCRNYPFTGKRKEALCIVLRELNYWYAIDFLKEHYGLEEPDAITFYEQHVEPLKS